MIKPILLTMGDPAGIGPETILKSFQNEPIKKLPIVVLGDCNILLMFKDMLNINSFKINTINSLLEAQFKDDMLNVIDFNNVDMSKYEMGKESALCGQAAFEYIMSSIQYLHANEARAVVTAPINKKALHMAEHFYPGHTEIYAESCPGSEFAMHLYDDKLSIIHASTHVSLLDAIHNLTQERVENVIKIAHDNMKKILGREPKIAVAGLNPHAGEDGLFGNQEIEIISPAIKKMAKTMNVIGPIPPDTVFYRGVNGEYDIVVAMYHDQGHIPFKMYAFESGVNTSAGLPIVRTSVDHGTAFNIAGQGIAKESSMVSAILLADKLTR